MKRLGLATQILIGLILGVAVGAIFYGSDTAISILQPVGDIFIHLIKMIVVPIVISALIVAVAGVGDIKKLGKLGGKTILYFEIVTTIAIVVGIIAANLFHPGAGVDMGHIEKAIFLNMRQRQKRLKVQGLLRSFFILFRQTSFSR